MGTHLADDGTVRQDHYGGGRQPWDDIRDAGWGPEFAAGNVLKYLRRTKDQEHSLESARWYWRELIRMTIEDKTPRAYKTWAKLGELITGDELRNLQR